MTTLSQYNRYYRTHNATAEAHHIKTGKIAYGADGQLTGTFTPEAPQGMRVFDDASQLYRSFTFAGTQQTVFLTLSGVVPSTANRRIFRIESPSGYSTFSLEVYASTHGTLPNRVIAYQADSTNSGIFLASSGIGVADEGRYSIFFSSNRTTGDYLFVINGQVYNTASTDLTGVHQTGSGTYCRVGSTSGSQYLRSGIGSIVYTNQYLTNWEDFMDEVGNPKAIVTSGWPAFGGNQPLVHAPNGNLDTNNLGSMGAFTWSP